MFGWEVPLLRLRFNGFDALILLFVIALVALFAHSAMKHSAASGPPGVAPATRTVEFTIVTMPTHYATAVMSHLLPGGQIAFQTSGSFVPMGTLETIRELPDTLTVSNGSGAMVVTTDPTEHVLRLTVRAQAVVTQKTVAINGNVVYVDEHAVFHEGGSQFDGVISDEQVR